MEKLCCFPRWFYLGLVAILVLTIAQSCRVDYDRLKGVKGKAELIVSVKIQPAAYQFSPDMSKVIFAFNENGRGKRGFINLEGSKRRIELFTACECGVQGIRWLDDTFFVTDGRCHKCNLLVDSRDLTTTRLSGEFVTAPIKDELIAQWKETDPLYYIPSFGGKSAWFLIPNKTAPYYYSLSLRKYDREALLAELGDVPIVVERPMPPRKILSPDGAMYVYTGMTGEPVKVYSADGEVLAEAGPVHSRGSAWALGWASDGRGVYLRNHD